MRCCICDAVVIAKETRDFPPGYELCPTCYRGTGEPCQPLRYLYVAALRKAWPEIRHAMARDNAAAARVSLSGQMRKVGT
jgi:hypothetical protein